MHNIYKCDPVLEWLPKYKRDDPYHCMNWTFRLEDGYMVDTYFNDTRFKVTPENESIFKLVCDLDEYHQVSDEKYELYNENDRIVLAIDSGGWNYPKKFVKNGATKDLFNIIYNLKDEISSCYATLNYCLGEIDRLYGNAWIPVTSLLPKIGEDVLIQDTNGNLNIAHLEEYKNENRFLVTEGYIWNKELESSVVAWRRIYLNHFFMIKLDDDNYPEVNKNVLVKYKDGSYGVDWLVDTDLKIWGGDGYPNKVIFWCELPEFYEL